MICRLFLIAVLQLAMHHTVFAFEPPRESILQALPKGKSAFLARVIKTEQIEKQKYKLVAEVTLEVQHCFYGANCEQNNNIRMKYFAQTTAEVTMPVQFLLGTDIVFILNQNLDEVEYYDSSWEGGSVDWAFICNNFPYDFKGSKEKINCSDIYYGKISSLVSWDDLIRVQKADFTK